ncbi:hypothetical protein H6G54_05020 [Anabaena cylindrica FACHB-243]|uniref:hypothetical protein n=1 Tax=Anabaena sp. PCC 7938 TaxID=1296340 RepID=UPI0002FF1067|nr:MULTISPECIES: hypothetical protein [Anabaena]MBD2417083.1 hypothetical protein [Anabaena cylindrica FACHB-243]MCM2406783.1 hypothetical protein [Anabaena sp. CCAP 1446/1C]BAY02127.1 hypothetical protein NIES19_13660 [Anabaena cylindrica PCC 7122]
MPNGTLRGKRSYARRALQQTLLTLVELSAYNGNGQIPFKVAKDIGIPRVSIAGVESKLYSVVFGSPTDNAGLVKPEFLIHDSAW